MCIMYIVPNIQIDYNYDIIVIKGGVNMPVSKAQQRAVAKYSQQNYDEIKVRVPKGKKDMVKNHAAAMGESVNGFIQRAIDETMQRDTQKGA